jgi:Fe-S cluster assembly protein SufD
MSSALNKPKYKMIIDNYYNQIANKEESLTSLNTAFAIEGVYINIPKAKSLTNLSKSCISQLEVKQLVVQPRNLVIVGENSHVQIIEPKLK